MSHLVPTAPNMPIPAPDNLPNTEITVALASLQHALDAGVAIAKQREDGKTERSLILAKKEIELKSIDAQTRRGISNDRNLHERRLELIRAISRLLTENATNLTPEIMSAAQFLLNTLREEK